MLKRAKALPSQTMKCAGWGGGSKATYGRGDVEQVLLALGTCYLALGTCLALGTWLLVLGSWYTYSWQVLLASRSLPEDDGGERVPSKPVGWIERFPLQVKQGKCDILNA